MQKLIDNIIQSSNIKNPIHYYLNGGCYIFAKKLRELNPDVELIYLLREYHFVVKYDNKLYDVTGNVTNKYRGSTYISEEEFLRRTKLANSIEMG